MQTIRGTKDILPHEVTAWQQLYFKALQLLTLHNYYEIRTPIIENTEVFLKSVGNSTDIITKEMYRFIDQGKRDITLRPEGTACIARSIASNKLYTKNSIQKLWYMGPMFRYERPQYGRQRQFHQLGIECIGSTSPLADTEVINIAYNLLNQCKCNEYIIEINSLGTELERVKYKADFIAYLENHKNDLDEDSKKRLITNPLRILDSKNTKTQELLQKAPCISKYLEIDSKKHFEFVCEHLQFLNIPYIVNRKLVRGLDYYNHTAFEITHSQLGSQNTICGGGRYTNLINQFGGPNMPGVGWAIGVERLLMTTNNMKIIKPIQNRFEIITQGSTAQKKVWCLIQLLETHNIMFNLSLSNQNINKQIKKAIQNQAVACLILGDREVENLTITIKWLNANYQETIKYSNLIQYLIKKLE